MLEGCSIVSAAAGEAPGRPVCDFSIPGRPVPWARSRVYVKGSGEDQSLGFATPKAQRAFKRVVAEYARVAMLQAGRRQPLVGPVWLSIRVFIEPPQKVLARMVAGAVIPCVERPDFDNWVKLPMDAMNGLVYVDDAQVQGFPQSGKFWVAARPRLEVEIWA